MRLLKMAPVVAALALFACGTGEDNGGTLGAMGIGAAEVSVPLEIADIDSVVVTVSAPDIPTPLVANLAVIGNIATGLIAAIPAGVDRTFSVHAYVGAVLVCTGSATVDIIADVRASVGIVLDCSVPPPSTGEAEVIADFNFPPEIVSVSAAPSPVGVSGLVNLEVVATDPNPGDTLAYLWSATDGTFDATDAAAVVWTAPAVAGDYDITIEVSDGTTTVSVTVTIVVSS
jgi:hypothetical protein